MAVFCDPNCIGPMTECCYQSIFPMGLMPLEFSFGMLFKITYLFTFFVLKDAWKGLFALSALSLVGIVVPDFVEVFKKCKKILMKN